MGDADTLQSAVQAAMDMLSGKTEGVVCAALEEISIKKILLGVRKYCKDDEKIRRTEKRLQGLKHDCRDNALQVLVWVKSRDDGIKVIWGVTCMDVGLQLFCGL